ncbi:protein FAR-RED ELONGATED HYPOCOTYL 3-like [Humulus lupulus]|uniref:protein FAR-RED ELONGATED HYPOCOTYL 3-like n=1 Tax=Humulus lupulus TaxID=3486 RepID=UPI002B403582|nr:protein FAR-RED ELONGATED HYPOCOTYL 3-like [Humulus lupulus]
MAMKLETAHMELEGAVNQREAAKEVLAKEVARIKADHEEDIQIQAQHEEALSRKDVTIRSWIQALKLSTSVIYRKLVNIFIILTGVSWNRGRKKKKKNKNKNKKLRVDVQMGDGIERIGTYAGESSALEGGSDMEPHEGMVFESEEAGRAFYDDYARKKGFLTRVLSSRKSERDGSIISRGLGCRGLPDNRTKIEIQKQGRQRDVCTAMILLKRENNGRWVVRKFVSEHNHPLVVHLQKSRRILDDKDKKIQELTAELRVKKRLSASYREQLLAVMKDVEEHNGNVSNIVQLVYENLRKLESKRQQPLCRG